MPSSRSRVSRTYKSMRLILAGIKDFWNEYKRYKIGLAGLTILIILLCMAAAANIVVPKEIREHWATSKEWVYNPKEVPPAWINFFSTKKYLEPTNLKPETVDELWRLCYQKMLEKYKDKIRELPPELRDVFKRKLKEICKENKGYYFIFRFDNKADEIGKDVMIIIKNLKYPAEIYMDIYRPDGINITDVKLAELSPISEAYVKLQFHQDLAEKVLTSLIEPIDGSKIVGELREKVKIRAISVIPYIFKEAEPGISRLVTETLKGEYTFVISVKASVKNVTASMLEPPDIIIRFLGACYGLLGTDGNGRDNFVTILLGSQLALLLGFTYSTAAVFLGVIYGATSGYMRSTGKVWVDELMQRINEVVYSLPILPFLIIFSYYLRLVYKIQPNIWHIAGLLLLFGWSGIAIVTRSMTLSIMSQPYIEAAIALGASGRRILFRHVLPQLVPYAFAAIALNIPGAILMEAGLSFLGLTDPNMPSWGRMLYEAQNAIYDWWWIIPPGLMITLTAVAFAFIGTALDTIINPRLRRA